MLWGHPSCLASWKQLGVLHVCMVAASSLVVNSRQQRCICSLALHDLMHQCNCQQRCICSLALHDLMHLVWLAMRSERFAKIAQFEKLYPASTPCHPLWKTWRAQHERISVEDSLLNSYLLELTCFKHVSAQHCQKVRRHFS